MTDSGVDSEVSPSSPDSVSESHSPPGSIETLDTKPPTEPTNTALEYYKEMPAQITHSTEELVAKMEVDDECMEEKFIISDEKIADKMETVEALLSLSDASRSPGSSPEKTLITIIPAHNPDKGNLYIFQIVLNRCHVQLRLRRYYPARENSCF